MSLKDCIASAQRQGLMTLDEAQALYKRYDQLARQALAPADIRARIIAEQDAAAVEAKRRGLLMETKRLELVTSIMSYKDARGRPAPHKGLAMLPHHFGHMGSQADLQTHMEVIIGRAQARMEEVLYEFRKGAATGELRRRGQELTARMENIVRELFGQSTDDIKAKQLAEAWTEVAEALRVRFNGAGGAIGKLERWGLPQVHSAEALLNAGGHPAGSAAAKQAWTSFITPLLDRSKMKHPLTGQSMSDAELAESLAHVYDTIVTEGWNTREPSGQPQGRGALFKQHADHRFLAFKDADSWLNYQRAYGEGDPFAAMMGHISFMARDIAAMEVLGPNPDAMLNYLRQTVIKTMGSGDNVTKALKNLDERWAHYRGSANMPVSSKMANTVAGARNLVSAASLGSAAISAISDHATDAVTRGFVGLPILKAFTGWVQYLGTDAQRHAVRSGLIQDSALHATHQHARYMGSISGRTWTGYINDRVLAFSGLNAMTVGRKYAFGMDMFALAADLSRFSWDELSQQGGLAPAFRRTLERHGFDAASWNKIRVAPQYQPERGAGFVASAGPEGTGILRPEEIEAAAGRELADRYHAMVLRETRHSVIESTLPSRAAMIGTNQPGTFMGELLRSAGQFKTFGATFFMLHGDRIFRELAGGNPARGAVYAGALLIATTLMGGVALQLKEIANGRDPRRMDMTRYGAKFWGAALLQGGGLGIYGDFLFSDVNRHGGSLAGTVAGPMIDRLDVIRRLTVGNILELGEGRERTNAGRELANFIRTNTPGSSLWYARLAWNRVLMDQLQYLMDPDAHAAFRRQVQARRRDYRQDFWWRPGEREPMRQPDLGAMFPPN